MQEKKITLLELSPTSKAIAEDTKQLIETVRQFQGIATNRNKFIERFRGIAGGPAAEEERQRVRLARPGAKEGKQG
jgi:hypothetical protein